MEESETAAPTQDIFRNRPHITDPILDDPEEHWPHNKVNVIRSEIERCLRKLDTNIDLELKDFDCATANWDRKNAVVKHNRHFTTEKREFNKRMTQTAKCNGHYIVAVNETITEFEDFIDSVRHEVAHAVLFAMHDTTMGHGEEWKEVASRLGADPSRTSNNKKESNYSYYIVCPECEYKYGRHRKTSYVKDPSKLICSNCDNFGLESFEA